MLRNSSIASAFSCRTRATKRSTPFSDGPLGQPLQQRGAGAACPCQSSTTTTATSADLGLVAADVAGDADRVAVAVEGDHRLVVAVVDLGQVAEVGGREAVARPRRTGGTGIRG